MTDAEIDEIADEVDRMESKARMRVAYNSRMIERRALIVGLIVFLIGLAAILSQGCGTPFIPGFHDDPDGASK